MCISPMPTSITLATSDAYAKPPLLSPAPEHPQRPAQSSPSPHIAGCCISHGCQQPARQDSKTTMPRHPQATAASPQREKHENLLKIQMEKKNRLRKLNIDPRLLLPKNHGVFLSFLHYQTFLLREKIIAL